MAITAIWKPGFIVVHLDSVHNAANGVDSSEEIYFGSEMVLFSFALNQTHIRTIVHLNYKRLSNFFLLTCCRAKSKIDWVFRRVTQLSKDQSCTRSLLILVLTRHLH